MCKKLPKTFFGSEDEPVTYPEAIGLSEVEGLVAAIEGLDAMTKAADVRVVHTEKRLGGRLVTFVVAGEISAVKAAVEAGLEAADQIGNIFGSAVIARPHAELTKFFDMEG